jgi:pyruvate/2-oxoglutarate dehydrogenase complex dihydrolipoamide dehydrogenase (E3) component
VVGAGAAGLSVAYGAARLGRRVALIERGAMGGECLNTGCIPSKALLHAAAKKEDWPAARSRIREAIAALAAMDSQARYEGLGVTVLRGQARFTGAAQLAVAGEDLSARRIVLAVGSRPRIPEFCRNLPYLTSETVWDLAELPGHLLILGGGSMGVEMAAAFAGLGAKVTLAGRLLPREDAELVAPLAAALAALGVNLCAQQAVGAAPGPVLTLADGTQISGTHLLLAAGREVDVAGLNLAAAGISAGPGGIVTDAGLHAGGAVYAAGDCADPKGFGPQRFTSAAGVHAGVLIRRLVFRLPARLPRGPAARAVYTAPELAQVGPTLAQAGPQASALVMPFSENDRAVAEGETAGLVKLVLDRRGRLVGAGIVAPGAGEMIGLYALAIRAKLPLTALAGLVLPYPTRAEAGKRAITTHLAPRLFSKWPRRLAALLANLPF